MNLPTELRTPPYRIAVPSAPLREQPDVGATWVTEAVAGEPARVVERRGDWAKVVLPLQPSSLDPAGYPGWIEAGGLRESSDVPTWQAVTASCSITDANAAEVERLPLGALLAAGEGAPRDGAVPVRLPSSATGWAPRDELAPWPVVQGGRDAVLRGLGLWTTQPYVWGGTSTLSGADCSGFTFRLYGLAGRLIPRDAHDQHDMAPEKRPGTLDGALPGDLVFFWDEQGTEIGHVGIYLGDGRYVSEYASGRGIVAHAVERDPFAGWGRYLP